ncbi:MULTISPECIES: tRNA (adenosine(37)-N6)-threonylcarbamoyltransferase complex ATPase subunit type 1 TsaE [Pseudoalteromonas]|jgi:tRNA threonylcarbamoyladenosine biosynthesis protein TsaE|uniref:tRNA (adenosine(37)-N6)-threonylcarbamoyltransferase complex ATPase subunit type 1 TsaE n=1 Tax=Pseudoalteromonas TaxID=53246 RepID=UPI0006D60CBD|nr:MULTISPECIES: tRNA (adenosine(37)-N6)-threonylcarbamoyltransferase complex ATPase subunit type 1 TsaE [Pseudoalteromonas]HBW97320.1 tRNA (adenosine(37)-N6)-threonylcarbamoyltransferase complex ATPase subunit type 1 TsaE [Pseudoalteromonas sp.]KPV90903.1 tRNA threonylcarbamoyladenosine biosynthesis protein TsaE [Pseudoalteromonas sp. P1-30]KPW05245.1 tRNA threonylcarbamoyladenosine biosynthesis protein TsaE [Pseudoalteromonas sp. P1-11]MCK8108055.1 tRNA (adenosine(37)-N6)-threonylcarbamoyltra|tara:strand:+ start:3345 stop:3821 length:477 start_codon:yes stop_codon:yes gene_type:complete
MTRSFEAHLNDEIATVAMGNKVAAIIEQGAVIYLHGDLGAGKTTFTRGVVQGFGHTGKVKSPTYTLVEPYELTRANVYHFDLYRLGDPEELEYMGIRDYFSEQAICIVEWPEKGGEFIPVPDLDITLSYVGDERKIVMNSASERGIAIVEKLTNLNPS